MNNSSPFGQSLQGSRSFQNNTQSAPQQMFGGFQPQQSFGGFGGGQGFGGFNPFQGGYGGGFQPQQQFNPFQGGYGGGFQPQGFGGGFNPMFGGIGGLGFNPMMGPQFSMPMQKFAPYQQQMFQPRGLNFDDSPMGVRPDFTFPAGFVEEAAQQNFPSMDMMYRGGPQMSPEMRARLTGPGGALGPHMAAPKQQRGGPGQHDRISNPFTGPGFGSRLPMYGGIGGLGFNPMMGPQFGMPTGGNTGVKGIDPEQQYQQEQAAAQQQRAMNPGGKSMQDWQAQYNQMYNPNRMTMDMPPSLEEFIQRRTNPISFPGMPGFTL